MKNKAILLLISFYGFWLAVDAQEPNYSLGLTALPGFTAGYNLPFWLRANQSGSIPVDGASLSLIGSARKEYIKTKKGFFDWGASLESRMNIGRDINFTLVEGYGKIKLGIFELRAGRTKEIMGLCDTTLSSGSYSVSGNALGIPKVQLSIPEFYTIPFLGRLIAFKGHFAHGWLGTLSMRTLEESDTLHIKTWFHQKSFYGRFGKPEWRLKLYGGFNHQAFWGNEKDFYGDAFGLTNWDSYLYVVSGTRYGTDNVRTSKVGNHLGSIDIGLEYRFDKFKIFIWRQNIYEAGALYYLANIQDGLNGFSIENLKKSSSSITWDKLVFELLYTKNQAGEPWSRDTPSPYEGYYNHYQYINGWSYKGIGLGTPFISQRNMVSDKLPSSPYEYFSNNRVLALHLAFEGSLGQWNYIIKSSWSKNYGTYWTTDEAQSTGNSDPGFYGIFGVRQQFSAFLECSRELRNGLDLGFISAFDVGELYNDSFGMLLKVSKSF